MLDRKIVGRLKLVKKETQVLKTLDSERMAFRLEGLIDREAKAAKAQDCSSVSFLELREARRGMESVDEETTPWLKDAIKASAFDARAVVTGSSDSRKATSSETISWCFRAMATPRKGVKMLV